MGKEEFGMREAMMQVVRPELKELVSEAVQSLAKLDAARLEELALSCRALNRDLSPAAQQIIATQSRAAKHEMAALARVLQATGANRAVLSRLHKLRASQMEYGVAPPSLRIETEDVHGLH